MKHHQERGINNLIIGQNRDGTYLNNGLCSSDVDLVNAKNSNDRTNDGVPNYRRSYNEGSSDFVLVDEPDAVSDIRACIDFTTRKFNSVFTKKMLYKRVPVLNWLPKYNKDDFVGDLVAGITVGLTIIPQSLAYATVAKLPPIMGLYGGFVGCLLYIVLGTCKDIPAGPTAITSVVTAQILSQIDIATDDHELRMNFIVAHAILLAFVSGIIEFVMGIFGLGFLVEFVSGPVGSGFTSAVALIMLSTQVKDILGLQGEAHGSTFIESCGNIYSMLVKDGIKVPDVIVGSICIVVLLSLKYLSYVKIGPKDSHMQTRGQKIFNYGLWLFCTSRNAILVLVCAFISFSYGVSPDGHLQTPYEHIDKVDPGMPEFKPPPFSLVNPVDKTTLSLFDMLSNFKAGIVILPLIAIMEDISICKAFGNGKAVDATQEMIAIGVVNIASSFVGTYPGGGSMSRSAIINSSGSRTPFSGFYTAFLVILALVFLTPYFTYIPKASLAAIIIAAVIFMLEFRVIKPMWRAKKADLIPFFGTFILCLVLKVEIGMALGVCLNVLFILYHAARPKITIQNLRSPKGAEYLMLTPDRCLIFPSVAYVRNLVTKHGQREDPSTPVVIDCTHIYGADFTAAKVVESLTNDFAGRGQPLYFYNLKPSVYAVFEGVAPKDFFVYYTEDALDDLLKQRADRENSKLQTIA